MKAKYYHRYVCLVLLIFFGTSLIAGCGSSKKQILDRYTQSVQPIMDGLGENEREWDRLRTQNQQGKLSNRNFVERIENEMLPRMLDLQDRMEKIEPDKELRNTHELGIKMINKNVQALNEVLAAVYDNDMSKITSANKLLSEARELERQYVNQIKDFDQ